MSMENVVLFGKAVNKNPELKDRLAKTEKTADWVNIAKEAGFEFTAEEYCAVVAQTIQKEVTAENAVREYLAAQLAMGPGELEQRSLESVVGGKTAKYIVYIPYFFDSIIIT
jgi:predicted ribosomally synthesized peptide with nif11-like leader